MPSDLRPSAHTPSPHSTSSRTFRFFLIGFVGALYALLALRYSLPPANWIQKAVAKSQEEKVLQTRPALRNVERYSPQHRYRPAASPVITQVGKDGKVKKKGEYV